LVHMQPQEVAGLQALAKSQGTSLTVNPNTGMPEAFNLGNFFSSLLPTLAGFMIGGPAGAAAGLEGTAATLAPIMAGAATGAAVAGAKGEDVLSGALTGGLGGYGGGNLGSAFGKMGGAGAATPAISSGQGVQLTANNLTSPNLAGLSGNQAASALDASANNLSSTLTNPLGTGTGGAGIDLRNMMNQGSSTNLLSGIDKVPGQAGLPIPSNALDLARPPSGFDSMLSGVGKFASDPIGQFDAFKAAGGSGYSLGAPLAMAGLSAMQPEPYDFAADEAKRKAEENKYRDPITGRLNLSASSGLNLTGFAMGGQVNSNPSVGGGISDLYNRPEGATTQSISSDGYGMGRLDRLSQEGSLAKAADMFYAQGGPVSFADGGDTGMNLDKLPSLNLGSGRQGYSGGSGDILASMDPNDPMVQQFFKPGIEKMRAQYNVLYGDGSDNILNTMGPNDPIMQKFLRPGIEKMRAQNKALYGDGPDSILNTIDRNDPIAQKMLIPGIEKIRAQNKAVFGYVKGGYLDGQGDGMSDSIPATIEGKQPARLADGEFVVPADVVSHLGNGSSKAGSKRLYAMLDKIRHARTGTKKQGKQIKPEKYMPA
jgi:hypothetical protein